MNYIVKFKRNLGEALSIDRVAWKPIQVQIGARQTLFDAKILWYKFVRQKLNKKLVKIIVV